MANLDLSGIITRICADLKTKFSKVTFIKEGTGDFDITVDGTRYHIASPAPASRRPLMDGTVAVGILTDYARADHVHPTDTSRQAALVSGTNIKTINNESLLGSGNITISGGSGGSTVTVTQTVTAGTQIASISVDGSSTSLYTPTPTEEVSISSTQPSADSDLKIWIEI